MNALRACCTKRFAVHTVFLSAALTQAATRYVALNGGHVTPFDTWAKAATNIQDAVDVALAGDTVLVTNGYYQRGGMLTPGMALTARVCITRAITLRSVNGPRASYIAGAPGTSGSNGDGAVRCLYVGSNVAAMVSGFTLTNGHTLSTILRDTYGGGAYLDGAGVLSNCLIAGNRAYYDGGGVYAAGGGTVIDCVLHRNRADANGGGVYAVRGVVRRCHLSRNYAGYWDGGGAYLYDAAMSDCIVSNNGAGDDGGGVYCDYNVRVENCLFTRNTASYGAGAFMSASGGELRGCILVTNVAMWKGGGVYCYYGGSGVNCTFSRNHADDGGGVYAKYGGVFTNCIFWLNTAFAGSNMFRYGYGADAQAESMCAWCCCPGFTNTAAGNIGAHPLLANVPRDDLHLLEGSPCINAGINLPWMPGATDLDGAPRIHDGRVDMGCYEFVPEPGCGGMLLPFAIYSSRFALGRSKRRQCMNAPCQPLTNTRSDT